MNQMDTLTQGDTGITKEELDYGYNPYLHSIFRGVQDYITTDPKLAKMNAISSYYGKPTIKESKKETPFDLLQRQLIAQKEEKSNNGDSISKFMELARKFNLVK